MYWLVLTVLFALFSSQIQALTLKKGEVIGSDGQIKDGSNPLLLKPACPNTSNLQAKRNSAVNDKLLARRTVNVFRAWDTPSSPPSDVLAHDYGLYWTVRPKAGPATITLSQINWSFNYPRHAYDDYPGITQFILDKDWKHEEEYGKTLTVEFWNEAFPAFISNVAVQEAEDTDGVMLDWWRDAGGVLKSTGLTQEKVRQVRTEIAKDIRKALGPDKIILGNVGWDLNPVTTEYINGVFLELYKKPGKQHYTNGDIKKMEASLKYYDECLLWPKIVAMAPWRVSEKNDHEAIPPDHQDNLNYARLFAAMAMVIPENGYILYSDNNWDRDSSDYGHVYYEFYNVDLGQAISSVVPIVEGVAYKTFEEGYIIYNRLNVSTVVALPESTELEVPPLTGLFCKRTGENLNCQSSNKVAERKISPIPVSLPKYDRTLVNLRRKFDCLRQALSEEALKTYPTKKEIADLIVGLKDNKFYRTKRHLVKLGLSEKAVKAHKVALLRLVNFEGINEAFCANPLR